MKAHLPGTLLTVLCEERDRAIMITCLFRYTTTIGVREAVMRRYVLDRTEESVPTHFGLVRRKRSEGYGVERTKYEYEDLASIAKSQSVSIRAVREYLEAEENGKA